MEFFKYFKKPKRIKGTSLLYLTIRFLMQIYCKTRRQLHLLGDCSTQHSTVLIN
uniref:Uncharacterized protein n=1 Tax=Anguilla anguilla TaxID=7936 RepID=A0A0E9S5N4_ANGAN